MGKLSGREGRPASEREIAAAAEKKGENLRDEGGVNCDLFNLGKVVKSNTRERSGVYDRGERSNADGGDMASLTVERICSKKRRKSEESL